MANVSSAVPSETFKMFIQISSLPRNYESEKKILYSVQFDNRLWSIYAQLCSHYLDSFVCYNMYITVIPMLLNAQSAEFTVTSSAFGQVASFKMEKLAKKNSLHGPYNVRIVPSRSKETHYLIFEIKRKAPVDKIDVSAYKQTDDVFTANLLDYFGLLFKSHELSDITLRVQGQEFPVHKILLSASSPVFRTMIHGNFREAHSNVIEIQDFDPKTISEMLKFIYSHKVPQFHSSPDINALTLYEVSHMYDIQSLLKLRREELLTTLDVNTALDCLALADTYEDQEFKQKVLNFICEEPPSLSDVSKFKKIVEKRPELLEDILTCKFKYK